MNDKKHEPEIEEIEDMEEEEFTVVELESEDGEIEEFVIIEQIEVDDASYVLMTSLEAVEDMEVLSEEEYREVHGEAGGIFIMRNDGDDYAELNEEEYEKIKVIMDEMVEANRQAADEDGSE